MSVLCSSAPGSSLPLLEPAALKGDWQLAAIGNGKAVCEVQLSDEAVANTNAFRFSASAECLQPLALQTLPVAAADAGRHDADRRRRQHGGVSGPDRAEAL